MTATMPARASGTTMSPDPTANGNPKSRTPLITAIVALTALAVVGFTLGHTAPTWLDAHVRPWFDSVYKWSQLNNGTNWAFRFVFHPIADAITWSNDKVLSLLRALRWPGMLALTGVIGLRTGGRRAAIIAVLALAGCGVLGFWDDTLITVALMLVAVGISLLIGIPLGIWAGLSQRADRVMRTILDTAQVMPAFCYLLPLVVAFGIGIPPAVMATVIYAIPPAVRLTSLGIRGVAVSSTEVGTSFGCTGPQLLTKVRLPLARRAILLGINQVIMMAFGVVVISALVGTGGLGQDVSDGLAKVNVGLAFAPGLAIVFAAVAIDRITTGERPSRKRATTNTAIRKLLDNPRYLGAAAAIAIIGIAIVAKVAGLDDFPHSLNLDVVKPVNSLASWVNDHFRHGIPIVGGTGSFSDFFVIHLLTPMRDLFQAAAWWVIIVVFAAIGWLSGGWRLATLCAACLVGVASLRVWDLAMDTLSQVFVAVLLSVALAVPIGIWSGRSDRLERLLRPLLDAAQVMPAFVYLVPVIFLFNVGRVPGVIASVIYAIPPGIRLTSLGLRQVSYAPREAALSFGATPRQELLKVQLPLALRSIMLALNQTIIMVLSMVVIAALIGGGGLGLETVYGLRKGETGRGMAGGLAIVLLAIVLDRITQAWGKRSSAELR
jgi:glycine betaine/proline transport system permease protein